MSTATPPDSGAGLGPCRKIPPSRSPFIWDNSYTSW